MGARIRLFFRLVRFPSLPRAAQLALGAGLVTVAATVAAAARDGGEATNAATPAAGAVIASGATTTPHPGVVGPTEEGWQPLEAPTVETGPNQSLEGAVEEPETAHEPGADLRAAEKGRFVMPLRGWGSITDRYGAARGRGLIHGGIDLALDGLSRSLVTASCAGRVATAAYSSAYGYHVVIDCGDGWGTLYGHLSALRVAVGDPLEQYMIVGISGSTGYSTGEHLHFEILWQGKPVNPENYLEFHIAPGTPLSSGPLIFPNAKAKETATPEPSPTPTSTPVPPTATPTKPPTPTATPTVTPTPKPPTATPTSTPKPAIRK